MSDFILIMICMILSPIALVSFVISLCIIYAFVAVIIEKIKDSD